MEAEVFLDAAFAIALAAESDQYHVKAVALSEELEAAHTRLVTTQGVLLEIGNALAKPRFRQAAIALLASLETDPNVEVVMLTKALYNEAFSFYRSRADKDWGLVDCLSFVVMAERGLRHALTSDVHFTQAGFVALLR